MEINQIFLGIQTMFGDSDVVQTHIQFWGFFVGILTVIILIITLNLQRISMNEQLKVNKLQNQLALKELTPIINLNIEITEINSQWIGLTILNITNAPAIINSYGNLTSSPLINDDENLIHVTNSEFNEGNYNLNRKIINNFNEKIQQQNLSTGDSLDDFIIEIFYSDSYQFRRYRTTFHLVNINSESPRYEMLEHNIIYKNENL